MANAHQIRELITETTTGTVRPRVPREVRDEVCRYAVRHRKAGAAWARAPFPAMAIRWLPQLNRRSPPDHEKACCLL